ncbi:MAG: hypothetical protein IJJ47_13930 [Methanosphaera sp.]|nr:hypothetical protein [Methanosphaera sp.]
MLSDYVFEFFICTITKRIWGHTNHIAFGNCGRNSAFIVNQTSGEVTKLSPEESYTYFEGDSLFSQISNMIMGWLFV